MSPAREGDQQTELEALRAERDELLAVLESSTSAFCAVDAQFRLTRLNSGYERLLGRPRADLLGRDLLSLVDAPDDAARLREAMHARTPLELETFHQRDGRWWRTHVYPQPNGGLACFIRDVSEQKRAEAELRDAVAARDTFMAVASHELRSPLNALLMQAQLNARAFERDGLAGFPAERLQKSIANSLSQTTRLSRLVNDLLDVTRLTAGKLALAQDLVDLGALVTDATGRLQPLLDEAQCSLTLQVAPGVQVRGDAFRLEQVLTNLLTNAMKHAPKRPVEVSLSAASEHAVLAIRDHGEGIEAAAIAQLFERFGQGPSGRGVSTQPGLGLGLYIARHIVEAHHGDITVHSPPGEGATFTVRLPLAAK